MTRRSRKRWTAAAVVAIAIMAVLFTLTRTERADIVFLNGTVYSLDSLNSTFEAFAVSGGRIVELATTEAIRSRYQADSIVDLGGHAVVPGFVDAHGRLVNTGILSLTVDVSRVASAREAAHMVREHARAIPPGTWIRGRGWKNEWWTKEAERPRALLDSATNEHPVVLAGEVESSVWVNSLALARAGIVRARTEHEPGTIIRDRDGEALGILLDQAAEVMTSSLPPATDWELNAALDSASGVCLRAGITTMHDFGLSAREIELYQKRAAQGTLPVRIYGVIGGAGETWEAFRQKGPLIGGGQDMLSVRALELYVDGALESRSAALMEPYADDPATRGVTFSDERELAGAARSALALGFQVCMNATGDRAVHVALSAYAQALEGLELPSGMLRLERVQLINVQDMAKAAALGATFSMQPAQYLLDFDVAAVRLGPERMAHFLPWDEALASGATVAGGTDMPLAPAEPFLAVSLVVDRMEPHRSAGSGRDTLGALGDALRMFTAWSARAGLEDDRKGSLERGKLADFLVLSDDPFRVGAGGLARIRVLTTVVGGRVAYQEAPGE